MLFKKIINKINVKKYNYISIQKIFHVTESKKKYKRIILFVNWDKNYKNYELIEKKSI